MRILKDYWYTIAIIGLVILGFNFPDTFTSVGGVKLSKFIRPFLQLIMFGMGATMAVKDFVEIFRAPRKVAIGVSGHYLIMPLLGYLLSRLFNFSPELAAGIVLIGCSPIGLASNVMALLGRANVALAITNTTVATLMAPVVTPFLMKLLGGSFIHVDFWKMLWDMIQIVLLPIILGLVIHHFAPRVIDRFKTVLPFLSMIGIAYVTLVVTASGQASLRSVGLLLLMVVVVHNLSGLLLGYFAAKALKLNEPDARAIAFGVGMQNAGLASALANEMGKIATVGLAAGIFGPFMNLSGSILANFWKNKPITLESSNEGKG